MARGLVVGDLRVQVLERAGGFRSFTVVWPEGAVHEAADVFLRAHEGSGTAPAAGSRGRLARARRMLRRAEQRAGPGAIRPHAFRHSFTTAVLDACGGNPVIVREAGGWASATVVEEEIYAHADVHDPAFDAALRAVWGEEQ